MPASRIRLILFMSLSMSMIFFLRPSFSEMNISEKSLPEDIIIAELYQPGNGLPVGKIQSLRGDVVIFHRDDPAVGYRANTGLPLYQGDTIRTRNEAMMMGRLIDGSQFVLMPQTSLSILRCNYNSARKTSLSFLAVKQGEVLFKVKKLIDLASFDFKIQTETIFAQTKEADFAVKAGSDRTDIFTFEDSRLEATSLAEPERIIFLSDFQRLVAGNELGSTTIEAVSQSEAAALKAQFRLVPQSKLFASSPDKYRSDRPQDAAEELPEIEDSAIYDSPIDNP